MVLRKTVGIYWVTWLLGLVAIYEYQAPAKHEKYWWRADGPEDRWETIFNFKLEFDPAWQRA